MALPVAVVAGPVVGFVTLLCCRKRPYKKTCCPPNKPVRGVPCPPKSPPRVIMHKPAVGRHRPPIEECDIFPWMPEQVNDAIMAAWNQHGMRTPEDLATHALTDVYPTTPDGMPVSWPAEPDDCAAVRAIEERVQIRAALVLADKRDEMAEQVWYESGGR